MFNKYHSKFWDMGSPHIFDIIRDVEFGGTQILDVLLRKWFSMDSSFQIPDFEEEDELEENLPTKIRKRNFPPSLST
jgi:hypothetical protein